MSKPQTTPTHAIERVAHTTSFGIQHIWLHHHIVGYVLHGTICVHDPYPSIVHNGEIYLLSAGWHYIEYLSHDKAPCDEIVVRLSADLIGATLYELLPTPSNDSSDTYTSAKCVHQHPTRHLALFFKSVGCYLSQHTFDQCEALEHIKVKELLHLLFGTTPHSPLALSLSQLLTTNSTDFVNLVNSNSHSKQTIAQLAQKCGMCASTFKATFKRHYGCPPHRWFITQRLRSICIALRHTDEPIKNISHNYGFASPSHMIRLFKANYGVTPAQYRSQNSQTPLQLPQPKALPQATIQQSR